jgi:type II secretory pathway pseudopilin PulG
MKPTATVARRGMTLIEVCVSVAMLGTFLGSLLLVLEEGTRSARSGMARQSIEGRARRTLDRIAGELASAVADSLTPNPTAPYGSQNLSFQRVGTYSEGAMEEGELVSFELELDEGELDDNQDNDGDGLIDERRLVLTREPEGGEPVTSVIAHGIAELLEGESANGLDDNGNGLKDEAGLSFQRTNNRLIVRLTVEQMDSEGNHLVRTLQTTVRLRN